MKTIKYNSTGHDVDVLQTLLDIPHNPAHEFNKTTNQAVIDFQKRNGLDADGIVGYKTWEMLFFHDERPKYGITETAFDRAAMLLDCEAAALKAVQKVETGGKGGFLPSGRPTILFEGHIFWQQLRTRGIDPQGVATGNEDILYPKCTKAHYKGGERNTSACSVPDISMKMLPTPRPHGACSRSWVSTMLPVVSRL